MSFLFKAVQQLLGAVVQRLPLLGKIFDAVSRRLKWFLTFALTISLALNVNILTGDESINHIQGVGIIGSTLQTRIANPSYLYNLDNSGDNQAAENSPGAIIGNDINAANTGDNSTVVGGDYINGSIIGDVVTIINQSRNIISAVEDIQNEMNDITVNQSANSIVTFAQNIIQKANSLRVFSGCEPRPSQQAFIYESEFQGTQIEREERPFFSNQDGIFINPVPIASAQEPIVPDDGPPNRSHWLCGEGDHPGPCQ